MTYDNAIKDLEKIVAELESGSVISMDEYTAKAKQAAKLIDFCTKKLRTVDTELKEIMTAGQ